MNITSFKKSVDVLSRYADTRAQDHDPRSKIGVQVDGSGNLTLISGSSEGGILYRYGPVTFDKSKAFAINAKPLLQAAKILKGKGSVELSIADDVFTLSIDGGGSVDIPAQSSLSSVGFVKKPKSFDSHAAVRGETWEQISRIIGSTDPTNIEPPTIQVADGKANIVSVAGGMRSCYARYTCDVESSVGFTMSPYPSFWEAIKSVSEDGMMSWSKSDIMVSAGSVECWSKAILFSNKDNDLTEVPSWPILTILGNPVATATISRTALIEAIRGVTPGDDVDSFGRVTMSIMNNGISLSPFGDESMMKIPCVTSGSANRSIRSEYIVKMLRASFGKEVTISVYNAPPVSISSPEMLGWTVLVAPVAFG